MARILFFTAPTAGHINPHIGIAQWLVRQGHEVDWIFRRPVPAATEQLRRIGLDARALDTEDDSALHADSWQRLFDIVIRNAPRAIEALRPMVREHRPDAMVIDAITYPGHVVALLEGVPHVSISTGLTLLAPDTLECELLDWCNTIDSERQAIVRSFGVTASFRALDCLSPWTTVAFTTEALVGDVQPTWPLTLAGPSMPLEGRGDEPAFEWSSTERPIYLSLSTRRAMDVRECRSLVMALAEVGPPVIVSAGALAREPQLVAGLPRHVHVLAYTPQLKVLAIASAFITHGGANAVMEALYFGVPMVVLAKAHDEPVQGHFVERAGAGIWLRSAEQSPARIAEATRQLIAAANPFRERALELERSYRGRDGARAVADLISRGLQEC